jgi:hypothetical protein
MKLQGIHISLFLLLGLSSFGQISPGDLSKSHSDLEGMSNCTLCHDLGDKVSNKKCLDCHKDIQSLLNANRGYHANSKVRKQDCFECHSEHHGLKFDMIRFDEKNFNHDLTGYELEGKHEIIDCRKCHVSDFISDSKIKKRPDTFLGLAENCISCHNDFHQNTLSSEDCLLCHDMNAFNPAPRFDHNKADFILNGKHKEVACVECHEKTTQNGKAFQKFNPVPFNDCKTCHDDPHNAQLPGMCKECHVESSFLEFNGKGRFNHAVTDFELRGKHESVDCFSCHDKSTDPQLIFQDKKAINENNCAKCHSDQHDGKFGLDCAKCHSEKSFISLKKMDFFDHSITDFHLEGKHQEVDCKACHKGRYSAPIEFTSCNSCHADYHQGEFKRDGVSPDCITCHSLEEGFQYSLFTLDQHQSSSFPLEGAHMATPCFACHVSEEDDRWTFRDMGSECKDCHEDEHAGSLDETYFKGDSYKCTVCHTNEAWNLLDFDHDLTNWILDGKHTSVDCRACHFDEDENQKNTNLVFVELDGKCASCHENIHDDKFSIDGLTDCNRCHVTASWFPEKFDHNSTAFPLEGRHAEIECRECHEIKDEKGILVNVYKLGKFECIDCHY